MSKRVFRIWRGDKDGGKFVDYEEEVSEGHLHGFTDNYIKVITPYDPLLVNEIRTCHLAGIDPNGEMQVEIEEVVHAH